MQFKVPQFLDIEDTIFGPFTFREFIYLTGGGGICFVLYKLLGLAWGAIPILLVAGLAAALTFYRPNGKPLINMIEAGANYMVQSKLYIWKRRKISKKGQSGIGNIPQMKSATKDEMANQLSGNRLRDLAWSLDVLDLRKGQDKN